MTKKEFQTVEPVLQQLSISQYGVNYKPFYAWSPGSSHSKILVLVYPGFLRLVITSCNLMNIDTIGGDNHWYIHDLPKLALRARVAAASFEDDFFTHLEALNTPSTFLSSIKGLYDFSKVKVHLITSTPGVKAGSEASKHGLLRLRQTVQSLNLNLASKPPSKLKLEVCMASIGNLKSKWLNEFRSCALGTPSPAVADPDDPVPDINLFYPSISDVRDKASASAREGASNIGCHLLPWNDAPTAIKQIFHHYESKDLGCLFHQKFILAYDPTGTDANEEAKPYYLYIGSANFSQSAWGELKEDKRASAAATNHTKLEKMKNFECGVIIPGDLVGPLLEVGTESWQEGVVCYDQRAARYELKKDRAWNGEFFLSLFGGELFGMLVSLWTDFVV